jgi:hypothetical protein
VKHDTAIESVLAFSEFEKVLLTDGDMIPYEALAAVIGKDPQNDGYGYVMTARRRFEREKDCVLQPVPNVGIKRLMNREVVNCGPRDLKHIRGSARRASRRLSTLVPIEKQQSLTKEEQRAFLTSFSQLGILSHMLKPSTTKKIAAATETAARVLPVSETLALFGGKKQEAEEKIH